MLTELETKILEWIYSNFCKLFLLPFTWKHGKFAMKLNQYQRWNFLVQLLTFSTTVLKLILLYAPVDKNKENMNSFILHGIFILGSATAVICNINLWLYGSRFVKFINELLRINSVWGNKNTQN